MRGASAPRSVFIAIPTYTGQLPARVVMALTQTLALCERARIAVDVCIEAGNCHVDDCRNSLVRAFMQSTCDALLFIDADVAWRPDEFLRFVQHDRDVVAGIYPKKSDSEPFPLQELGGGLLADRSGLVEVEGVPTGFLKLSRTCLEQMIAAYGERPYRGMAEPDGPDYHILFERTWEPIAGMAHGIRYGGDYSFCRKWRAIGGRIYVDPEMTFDHEGPTRWTGRLADHWRARSAEADTAICQALEPVKHGDWSSEAFERLIAAWGNAPWSGTPDLLRACAVTASASAGGILECGSGLTTLVMAACSSTNILALEHDPRFAEMTAARINACGLGGARVRVVCAPIDETGWYAYAPKSAAVVIVDGPPRGIGRAGALAHIDRLRPHAVIVDDMDDGEQVDLAKQIALMLDAHIMRHGKTATIARRAVLAA